MKNFRYLLATAVAMLCLTISAEARRPMGTTMTGTVQSADHSTRLIVFAQDAGPVRSFVYTEQAKFWNGTADNRPSLIQPGMRVQVNLHNPLIGPDFVRAVKLLEANTTHRQSR